MIFLGFAKFARADRIHLLEASTPVPDETKLS
jgi:hypothetical protein